MKYRIFMVARGNFYCPFNLGIMGDLESIPPEYFNTPEEAQDYIENNAEPGRDYVILLAMNLPKDYKN
jgi:hypothetical protein